MNLSFTEHILLTDGAFLYKARRLNGELYEVLLLGVIGEREQVTLPTQMGRYPVKFVTALRLYEPGPRFPKIISDLIELPSTPGDRLTPDPEVLIPLKKGVSDLTLSIPLFRSACENSSSLHRVQLQNYQADVPGHAFYNCSNLQSVDLSECSAIGSYSFALCKSLQSIDLPETVRRLGVGAFYGSGLTTVALPPEIRTVPGHTFADCINLTAVLIPPGVLSIAQTAFTGSPNVEILGMKNSLAHQFAQKHRLPFHSVGEIMEGII